MHPINNNDMKVYHGSTSIVKVPSVGLGRNNLDFGKGFYVTALKEQATSWASRPLNADKEQILNTYEFNKEGIIEDGYRYKQFLGYDTEWLEFVIASRKGEPVWKGWDIIEGGIANDRVFNTIELYGLGLITQEAALQRLIYEQPNNQICILNQEVADKYLRFMESCIIPKKEEEP